MSSPRTDDQKIADELLSLRLLAGYHVDKRGREQTSYLAKNSDEEKQARAALARLVRDDMKGPVGEQLALAIDPDTPSASQTVKPTLRIRFESPARGNKSTWARDLAIIHRIKKTLWSMPQPKPRVSSRAVMPVPTEDGGFKYVEVSPVSSPGPNVHKGDEQAVTEAGDHYGLERSRIWEIWTRRKQVKPSAK